MSNKLAIITNSIFESHIIGFKKEILCFGVVISGFNLKYYVLSEEVNEDVDSNILEIVQDILIELDNIETGSKYNIEYEIFDSLSKFQNEIYKKNFICLYIKINSSISKSLIGNVTD